MPKLPSSRTGGRIVTDIGHLNRLRNAILLDLRLRNQRGELATKAVDQIGTLIETLEILYKNAS